MFLYLDVLSDFVVFLLKCCADVVKLVKVFSLFRHCQVETLYVQKLYFSGNEKNCVFKIIKHCVVKVGIVSLYLVRYLHVSSPSQRKCAAIVPGRGFTRASFLHGATVLTRRVESAAV